MNWIIKIAVEQVEGAAAHVLSGLGGAMVVQGLATHAQAVNIVGGLVAGIGVLSTVLQRMRGHQELWGAMDATKQAAAAVEASKICKDLAQRPLAF